MQTNECREQSKPSNILVLGLSSGGHSVISLLSASVFISSEITPIVRRMQNNKVKSYKSNTLYLYPVSQKVQIFGHQTSLISIQLITKSGATRSDKSAELE